MSLNGTLLNKKKGVRVLIAALFALLGVGAVTAAPAAAAAPQTHSSSVCPALTLPVTIELNDTGDGYTQPSGAGALLLRRFVVNEPDDVFEPGFYLQVVEARTWSFTTIYRVVTVADFGAGPETLIEDYPTGQGYVNSFFPTAGESDFAVKSVTLCVGLGGFGEPEEPVIE